MTTVDSSDHSDDHHWTTGRQSIQLWNLFSSFDLLVWTNTNISKTFLGRNLRGLEPVRFPGLREMLSSCPQSGALSLVKIHQDTVLLLVEIIACHELVLYGIRELVKQHYEPLILLQSEINESRMDHSVCLFVRPPPEASLWHWHDVTTSQKKKLKILRDRNQESDNLCLAGETSSSRYTGSDSHWSGCSKY